MTEKKLTKREMFGAMYKDITDDAIFTVETADGDNIEITGEQMKQFIAKEIELLNRKRTPSGKDKVNAEENEKILEHIKKYLEQHKGEGFTCTELMKIVPAEMSIKEITLPRISSLLNKAAKANNGIVRYEEKRKSLFKLAD